MKGITEIRAQGREFCQTEGSRHYRSAVGVEAIDLIIGEDLDEGFCLGSIIKYASRYKKTRNLKDLVKISDYAQILCGAELEKREQAAKISMLLEVPECDAQQ